MMERGTMNRNKIIIGSMLIVIMLLTASSVISRNNHNGKSTKEDYLEDEHMIPESINDIPPEIIDNVAPDLEQDFKASAKDFESHDINGNEVRLSDYKGEYIVLHFWNSRNEYSKDELAYFEEAIKKYEGQVTFLMVNMVGMDDETQISAMQFLSDNNLDINTIFDDHYDIRINYKVTSLPRTVFIDKNGLIQKNIRYSLDKETLDEQIGNLINN